MSVEIKVPQLGESIVEATVGPWLKQEGDTVQQGEALVELETEKVNVEVPSSAAGVLTKITRREGETVSVGDILGTVDETGQAAAEKPPEAASAPQTSTAPPAAQPDDGRAAPAPAAQQDPAIQEEGARATPLAKRIAAEHGVDLGLVQGTGPSGRVRREDVEAFLQTQQRPPVALPSAPSPTTAAPTAPPAAAAPTEVTGGRREERIRMSRRRQTIAQRLVEAQHTAAMLTTFNEADMGAVMEIRKRRRDAFKERYGISLGFMSFFTRAVVGALKAYPRLNAEIQGDEMVIKHYYDIGIAVGAEDGLVVPVVRDADRLSFAEIERQIASLAEKARSRQLSLADLQGGTFTITNGGIYGSLLSTPILNTPQVGILGMHKIQERPIALAGEVVIRPMMYLALSYDHRIVDGSTAVQFLVRIKELIEDPEALLLEG
jgi:2-oxoglutarate dehydrogenase E2 component (dihydrolipoamide succinyltransferase)